MSGRWTSPTGSTCDDVEVYDPDLESRRYYRFCVEHGKEPLRVFNTVTGDVTVHVAGQRPLRFVQRRVVLTTQETETRFSRHV